MNLCETINRQMKAINLIQILNLNLTLKILIWKTDEEVSIVCRMSNSSNKYLSIKNVKKLNLSLIFLTPYAHFMGQPMFACRYRARAVAKTSGRRLQLKYPNVNKVHPAYDVPECSNNLPFPLNLALANTSTLSDCQTLLSLAGKAAGINKLD